MTCSYGSRTAVRSRYAKWFGWSRTIPAWMTVELSNILTWSRVLIIKVSIHMAILSVLTSVWPKVTPAWLFSPTLENIVVRGFSDAMWFIPLGISMQVFLWLISADLRMTFDTKNTLHFCQWLSRKNGSQRTFWKAKF